NDVLVAAAAVELGSEHPIAQAIVTAGSQVTKLPEVTEFASTAGGGVIGTVDIEGTQQRVAAGRSSFITEHTGALTGQQELALAAAEAAGARANWVGIAGAVAGAVSPHDRRRATAAAALGDRSPLGVTPLLLTGATPPV